MTDLTDEAVKALLDQYERYTTGKDGMTLSAETTADIARALLEARAENARLRAERDAWRKGSEAQATEVEALRKERDDADRRAGAMLARVTALDADAEAARARVRSLAAENARLRADAQAAVALVVEKAWKACEDVDFSSDDLDVERMVREAISFAGSRIRALAPVDGLAMVEALRKRPCPVGISPEAHMFCSAGTCDVCAASLRDRLAAAQAQIEALRGVLQFYANPLLYETRAWMETSDASADGGKTARATLATMDGN